MMKPLDFPPQWIIRLLRVAGALLLGAALAIWITPVNAFGRNLIPVGCGSPATPDIEPLADFVCRDHVAGSKAAAVALAVAAAALLLVSEALLPRLSGRSWAAGVALAAVVAVPVLALSMSSLFVKVATSGADGTLVRCGTPLSPSTDRISRSLCGELAAREKSMSLAGVGLSLVALLGGGYITNGPRREDDEEAAGETTGSDADSAAPPEPTPEPTAESRHTDTTGSREGRP